MCPYINSDSVSITDSRSTDTRKKTVYYIRVRFSADVIVATGSRPDMCVCVCAKKLAKLPYPKSAGSGQVANLVLLLLGVRKKCAHHVVRIRTGAVDFWCCLFGCGESVMSC